MFKPTRVIAILAVVILSLIGPALVPVADAHDGASIEPSSVGAGLSHSELESRVNECLKLQIGLRFQVGLIGQAENHMLGNLDPVRGMFIIALYMDPALAEYQRLGCKQLLASVGYN